MIADFANRYRLKVRRSPEDNNESIVVGKQGQIYEYSDEELVVSFTPGLTDSRGQGKWCPKTWGNFRRKAIAAGMILRQNGDSDGSLSFDPSNREQARIALQIARIRQKRVLAPEKRAVLVARLATMRDFRSKTPQECPVVL